MAREVTREAFELPVLEKRRYLVTRENVENFSPIYIIETSREVY